MTRGTLALIAGLGFGIVLVWALAARTIGEILPAASPVTAASAAGVGPSGASSALAAPSAGIPSVATPSVGASLAVPEPTASPDATLAPTPRLTPRPTSRPTAGPTGAAASRSAYLAFLARLDGHRREVATQSDALLAAAGAGDTATARSTAVDMLRFADGERDWLGGHPPASCYADAHAAAGAMVEAYATVAERAIDWADAKRGLAALAALADLVDAGAAARAALDDLATTLRATTCRA